MFALYKKIAVAVCICATPFVFKQPTAILHQISEKALYFGTGTTFGGLSLLTKFGWGFSYISPWASTLGNEFLLVDHLTNTAAKRIFLQLFNSTPSSSFKGIPLSQSSWTLNQLYLSQIPAHSQEEKALLLFLKNRWLAKSTGFFSSVINWACPCFGVQVQVHPETTSCYSRDPSLKLSQTYENRMKDWKKHLPHPDHFPLLLTRPFDIQEYLPSCLKIRQNESVQITLQRIPSIRSSYAILDLTGHFSKENWLPEWESYREELSNACKENKTDPEQIICIENVKEGEIGGIRILPLTNSKQLEKSYQFLLKWISSFGLSATRVELDRCFFPAQTPKKEAAFAIPRQSKEEFVSYLNNFNQNWKSDHPQKSLMIKSTLELLKGLLVSLSAEIWDKIRSSPAQLAIAELSFFKIQQQLQLLEKEDPTALFFDSTYHIEEIHASLSSLLEIFSPFTLVDFSKIYKNLLISIPLPLQPFISCGIHASGMTSFGGIFKAVEKMLQKPPRVIYGENTYFECINTTNQISHASFIDEADEEAWKEVDLLIAQFNPALKRIDLPITGYKVEKIGDTIRKIFQIRKNKPLTVALDCTLDYINSNRVGELLQEFQKEIAEGWLNIVCYRSGLKFDLFGMDNYCGAPFYMIHNQDQKWASFDLLSIEPALQADRLSYNWFCLSYQNVAPYLEIYQKQIFENTRSLLNQVPKRLFEDKNHYRIIPVEEEADAGFIDIKITGPMHQMRGGVLAGGCLYIKCMEEGHPIFYRPSLGFYHPNFTMIFGEKVTTIRLTLGLDPAQIDTLTHCFEIIDSLNGSSSQSLMKKLL